MRTAHNVKPISYFGWRSLVWKHCPGGKVACSKSSRDRHAGFGLGDGLKEASGTVGLDKWVNKGSL